MANVVSIIVTIDRYLTETGRPYLTDTEANKLLAEAGTLEDSQSDPGMPLRKILKRRLIPHAYREGEGNAGWRIPNSGGDVAQCKAD